MTTNNQWKTEVPFKNQYNIIDDKVVEIREVTVHTFSMGDVEDPDLYAAEPLLKWQNSEIGKWVMSHAVETPVWHRMVDSNTFTYRYAVRAKLSGKDYTYWLLKWGDTVDKKLR